MQTNTPNMLLQAIHMSSILTLSTNWNHCCNCNHSVKPRIDIYIYIYVLYIYISFSLTFHKWSFISISAKSRTQAMTDWRVQPGVWPFIMSCGQQIINTPNHPVNSKNLANHYSQIRGKRKTLFNSGMIPLTNHRLRRPNCQFSLIYPETCRCQSKWDGARPSLLRMFTQAPQKKECKKP